jgi:uncharacterized protein YqiB (DUF1249 family)
MLVHYCHSIEVVYHYDLMRFMIMYNYDNLAVENDDTKTS